MLTLGGLATGWIAIGCVASDSGKAPKLTKWGSLALSAGATALALRNWQRGIPSNIVHQITIPSLVIGSTALIYRKPKEIGKVVGGLVSGMAGTALACWSPYPTLTSVGWSGFVGTILFSDEDPQDYISTLVGAVAATMLVTGSLSLSATNPKIVFAQRSIAAVCGASLLWFVYDRSSQ